MTVSTLALAQTLTDQLSSQETNIAQLQQQLATGKSLNQPSDNPAAVTQVLALSGQASQLTSWQSNTDTASSWLGTANQTANSVLDSMQSAQSLLLQSLNQGAQDPDHLPGAGRPAPGRRQQPALPVEHAVRGQAHLRRNLGLSAGLRRERELSRERGRPHRRDRTGLRSGTDRGPVGPGDDDLRGRSRQCVRHLDRRRHGAEFGYAHLGQPQRGARPP